MQGPEVAMECLTCLYQYLGLNHIFHLPATSCTVGDSLLKQKMRPHTHTHTHHTHTTHTHTSHTHHTHFTDPHTTGMDNYINAHMKSRRETMAP